MTLLNAVEAAFRYPTILIGNPLSSSFQEALETFKRQREDHIYTRGYPSKAKHMLIGYIRGASERYSKDIRHDRLRTRLARIHSKGELVSLRHLHRILWALHAKAARIATCISSRLLKCCLSKGFLQQVGKVGVADNGVPIIKSISEFCKFCPCGAWPSIVMQQ